jgi:oligosaccharyltransferase complex subunit beta
MWYVVPLPPILPFSENLLTYIFTQSFTIELSEYALTHLTPYNPPTSDAVQLEFSMLSPFHRLTLTPLATTPNSTIFGASFTLPDQHGIFNFRVNYKRPFLTSVDEKRQVTVRHFAHDEWPRSWAISAAWVWIAGIGVTVAGWMVFVALWLYSAPVEESVKKTQ